MIYLRFTRNKQGQTEIKHTVLFSLLCVFLETVYVFSVFLNTSLFDCKCKSLNRLGEHRKTTKINRHKTETLRDKH